MEEDLRARLLANTPLAAIVGARIAWIDRPKVLPAITLQLIGSGREYTYQGPTGFSGARVQVDCWGASYGSAKAVARATFSAIEPPLLQGGTRFAQSFLQGDPDFPPEDLPGGVTAYRVNMDFIVWHRAV